MNLSIKTLSAAILIIVALFWASACSTNDAQVTAGNTGPSTQKNFTEGTQEVSSITVQLLHQLLIDSAGVVLLDVRTPEEVKQGKLSGEALHINISETDFKQRLDHLDKEVTYYVYCKSGGRSSRAQQQMLEMGFKNVVNVEGGATAWQDSGFKLK